MKTSLERLQESQSHNDRFCYIILIYVRSDDLTLGLSFKHLQAQKKEEPPHLFACATKIKSKTELIIIMFDSTLQIWLIEFMQQQLCYAEQLILSFLLFLAFPRHSLYAVHFLMTQH